MSKPTGKLVAFYRGDAPDDRGRRLDKILAWDFDRLESTHDYIQWLFPLAEPSGANLHAPVLDASDIAAFRADAALQARLLASLRAMLAFYGFVLEDRDGKPMLARAADFDERCANWVSPHNHNFLRLTRILRSLDILGLPQYARALFLALERTYRKNPAVIGSTTFGYWMRAAPL